MFNILLCYKRREPEKPCTFDKKLTISLVRMCAKLATIAFGGVPTGMWKAMQHDSAAGNIRNSGCISVAMDISASTGSRMFAMATFDVNSVNVCAVRHTMNSSSNGGRSLRPTSELPSMADIPDVLPPSASAKPPPSRKIRLHGIFWLMIFQLMRAGVGAVGREAVDGG